MHGTGGYIRLNIHIIYILLPWALLSLLAGIPHGVYASEAVGLGSVEGRVYWIDMFGDARPLAWARVVIEGPNFTMETSTGGEGKYFMTGIPEGTYNLTASAAATLPPVFIPKTVQVFIAAGSTATVDFMLEQSGIPIPEFPIAPVMLILALLTLAFTQVFPGRWEEEKPSKRAI